MPNLYLDFETRNAVHDLEDDGLDNYSRTAEVIMLGWAIDDEEPQLWFPDRSPIPDRLLSALNDPAYHLIAWNVCFERTIFHRSLNMWFDYPRWRDVMVLARSWSLPGSLSSVSGVLRLSPEDRKFDGGCLIDLFCSPAREEIKHSLFGELGRFNDRYSHPEQWKEFEEYCKQDVRSERTIWKILNTSPLPESEWEGWFLDQKINYTGIPVNRQMVENGLWLANKSKEDLIGVLKQITGLKNPNSDTQMKEWARARGYTPNSLLKGYVQAELDRKDRNLSAECRKVLELRQDARKSSYKKLERILKVLGPDDRLRFQFKYGGAARTLRWASADVQTQNLPRPTKEVKKDYQKAVDLIMARDYDAIKNSYPSVIGMVTSSIRMMFYAPSGQVMDICDLNAIENRGLGFLSRCPAILKVFELGRCPYLSFAVHLFKRSYEELEAEYKAGNEERRQWAKAPVLGGGYGLGGGKLFKNEFGDRTRGGLWGYALNVCGVDMPREVAQESVNILRETWGEVVQYWTDLEEAFKQVILFGRPIHVGEVTWSRRDSAWLPCRDVVPGTVLKFDLILVEGGISAVRIQLPSRRRLHYLNPEVSTEDWVTVYLTDGEKISAKFGTMVQKDGNPVPIQTIIKRDNIQFDTQKGEVSKVRHWNRDALFYEGIEHSSTEDNEGNRRRKSSKWGVVKTYGGKLCENVVQAFCRDLLLNGMLLADAIGFEIFGMFHDEIAALSRKEEFGLGVADLRYCMIAAPKWSPGILLEAEGFESAFYRK